MKICPACGSKVERHFCEAEFPLSLIDERDAWKKKAEENAEFVLVSAAALDTARSIAREARRNNTDRDIALTEIVEAIDKALVTLERRRR